MELKIKKMWDEQNKKSFDNKKKIKSVFYAFDMFSEPMKINFEGKEKFGSIQGFLISLAYYFVMIAYF
jgi:hypothetical protein